MFSNSHSFQTRKINPSFELPQLLSCTFSPLCTLYHNYLSTQYVLSKRLDIPWGKDRSNKETLDWSGSNALVYMSKPKPKPESIPVNASRLRRKPITNSQQAFLNNATLSYSQSNNFFVLILCLLYEKLAPSLPWLEC